MNFHAMLQYVKQKYEPTRYMTFRLSALPTIMKKTIDFGKREGKTDAEILESLEKLATKFEKQIAENGFNL
jgi:hypothetical protein